MGSQVRRSQYYTRYGARSRGEIYVDQANGDDANAGDASAPLATIIEAERRIDDITLGGGVRIYVAPGTYIAPTFRRRILRAGIYIICEEFTELLAPQAAQAGSSRSLVNTLPGLGVDTYRGKTVEILSGAAAGDRRLIRDHTDTQIIPDLAFSAAVAANDQFRIVEPLATIEKDPAADTMELVRGNGASLLNIDIYGARGEAQAGVTFINFFIDSDYVMLSDVARFYGCELTQGVTFSGAGAMQAGWDGNDRGDFSSQAAGTGLLFGAPSDTSWSGWGLVLNAFGFFSNISASILGYVSGLNGGNGVTVGQACHLYIAAGSIFSTGPNGGIAVANISDEVGPTARVEVSGKTLFPDIKFKITATGGPGAHVFGEGATLYITQTDIDAAGLDGVLAERSGYAHIWMDVDVTASQVGVRARSGGRVDFMNGFGVVSVGNNIEVGNTPAASTIAALATNLDFVVDTPSDGSIVQRID